MNRIHFILLLLLVVGFGFAQNYRCDWNVIGVGGGSMTTTNYACGATAGQSATGRTSSTNYWGLIGFWQTNFGLGVYEQSRPPEAEERLATRLEDPSPNPSYGPCVVRYSLATRTHFTIEVYDLTGKLVRNLAGGAGQPGRYQVNWTGGDLHGRPLARGVYILKLNAGDCTATRKLIRQ